MGLASEEAVVDEVSGPSCAVGVGGREDVVDLALRIGPPGSNDWV
jgi:hypothetical protein